MTDYMEHKREYEGYKASGIWDEYNWWGCDNGIVKFNAYKHDGSFSEDLFFANEEIEKLAKEVLEAEENYINGPNPLTKCICVGSSPFHFIDATSQEETPNPKHPSVHNAIV